MARLVAPSQPVVDQLLGAPNGAGKRGLGELVNLEVFTQCHDQNQL